MSQWLPKLTEIAVVGGVGSGTINQGGLVFAVGIIPPSGAAVYDVTGTDEEGFVLYFGDNLVGNANMSVRAALFGLHTVTISDTLVNGLYRVKLWYENF